MKYMGSSFNTNFWPPKRKKRVIEYTKLRYMRTLLVLFSIRLIDKNRVREKSTLEEDLVIGGPPVLVKCALV